MFIIFFLNKNQKNKQKGSKETVFLNKVLNNLNTEFQKFMPEDINVIVDERTLVLLSDILVLSYFHSKDLQFENLLV
jgi:hypothetical protein